MESTGIYWIRLYHLLTEAGIEVTVANPMHIKQIPKRKTDKKDAKWMCMLLMNGLVRPSLIPESNRFELREYCRTRLRYTHQRSQALNRIVKLLERGNIKLRSVVSNIRIKSSMDIIRLLASGEEDIEKYKACCKGRLRGKIPLMEKALQGHLNNVDRTTIEMLLGDIDHFQRNLDQIEVKIERLVSQHYTQAVQLLGNISGIGVSSAQNIIGEIGDNMEKFATADKLTSWTGLAPGNHESGGKKKSTSTKKGNKYLRTVMVAVAWGAVRTKNSYWRCLFEQLKRRMKSQKVIIIIARRLLKVIYKTLKEKSIYQEGGIELFLQTQWKNRAFAQQRFANAVAKVPN